jgi:hypothetical protein
MLLQCCYIPKGMSDEAGVGGQGGLLDVSAALQLEWIRAFGLWLW